MNTFEADMFNNDKGGVGKTSLTDQIASILAAAGFYVGVVDGDKQGNTTSLARPRTNFPATLTDVVTGKKTFLEAMVQIRKRLWIVPADGDLKSAISFITESKDYALMSYRIAQLRKTLNPTPSRDRLAWWSKPTVNIGIFQLEDTTEEEFLTPPPFLDFLFFDTPPQENDLTISMIDASDRIYIPAEMDQFSIDGLANLMSRILSRFEYRDRKIVIAGILPNKILHKPGNPVPMSFLESVWRNFPTLARRPIHHDDTIPVSQAYHKAAIELNRDSRAVRELCALALELAGYQGYMAGVSICDICDAAVERAESPAVVEA